jgi:hypothetical protein
MHFVDIFFCLFCNFCGLKPGRKTEKNTEMAFCEKNNHLLFPRVTMGKFHLRVKNHSLGIGKPHPRL